MLESVGETERWVEQQPDTDKFEATYRWERGEEWPEDMTFEQGDAICIDPFDRLWLSVYGTFVEYVTDDVAKVYIPPPSDDVWPNHWFDMSEGEYLIHQGYITPQ